MAVARSNGAARLRRQRRVRKRIRGTSERPRLSVFRSNKHIYAQIIDDSTNRVIASASSRSKDFLAADTARGGNVDGAVIVGSMVAEKALQNGVQRVVFDRNGFLYHGRVAAVANAAREKGLVF
jgi:large subunit ribosomal protein L18